ncbi:MAG TPA: sulfur carrier protein ThiS [Cytophagaceae bacterium]
MLLDLFIPKMDMMDIIINNELKQIGNNVSLSGLLADLKLLSQKGIAVAINDIVIPKAEWDTYSIQEKDKVTIIRATQGG